MFHSQSPRCGSRWLLRQDRIRSNQRLQFLDHNRCIGPRSKRNQAQLARRVIQRRNAIIEAKIRSGSSRSSRSQIRQCLNLAAIIVGQKTDCAADKRNPTGMFDRILRHQFTQPPQPIRSLDFA